MTDNHLEALAYVQRGIGKPNRNEQADCLIATCILLGLTKRMAIREAMIALGFNPRHVMCRLMKGAGAPITGAPWRRLPNGEFELNREGDD